MGIGKSLKKGVSSGFKVKRWIAADSIKDNGLFIIKLFKSIFTRKQGGKVITETFEAAQQRMGLSDEDLSKRVRSGRYLVWFCTALSVALAVYMYYLFSRAQLLAGLLSLVLCLTMLAYAYREHFNIFQIQQRRLGCSFKQWFQYVCKKGLK